MEQIVDQFNAAATALQTSEFRRPRSPAEGQRMHKNPGPKDYTKLFDAVVPMIEAFATANSTDRASLASKLNLDARGILRTFASSMPVLAVRRQSPELIAQGLTALAILSKIDDYRDLTFYLCALHHSARKLGVNTAKLFADVATLTPSLSFQAEMRGFPSRPPESRDLAAFRFRETSAADGFDLVQEGLRNDGPRGFASRAMSMLRRLARAET